MSGINFLSENYIDQAALTILSGLENAQFPLANLKNPSTVKKFRSVGNSVVIQIDLLQTRDIDAFAVAGDATDLLGLTSVSIKTSVTTDFSLSPTISVPLSSVHNLGYVFFESRSHRYIELTLTGTGSYTEVGAVFVGSRINLPLNSFSISSFQYYYNDNSTVTANEYGQVFIDERNLQKRLVGTIQYATKEETEIIDDMIIYNKRSKPLWVILDPLNNSLNDAEYRFTIYGYLIQMPQWRAEGGQLYSATLSLRQVI